MVRCYIVGGGLGLGWYPAPSPHCFHLEAENTKILLRSVHYLCGLFGEALRRRSFSAYLRFEVVEWEWWLGEVCAFACFKRRFVESPVDDSMTSMTACEMFMVLSEV